MARNGDRTRQKVYDYIVSYTQENLFPPTIEEIRIAIGLGSKQTVWHQLQALEKQKLVEIRRDTNRGIKLSGYELTKIDSESNKTIDNTGV